MAPPNGKKELARQTAGWQHGLALFGNGRKKLAIHDFKPITMHLHLQPVSPPFSVPLMTSARYILASLLAPLAALLIPCLIAVSELNAEAVEIPNGSIDDGAIRGAGLFLFIGLPVLYLIAAVFYAATAHFLIGRQRLSLRAMVSASVLAPWFLVLVACVGHFATGKDIISGLFIFGMLGLAMSLFAALGAVGWWVVVFSRIKG